MQKVFFLIVALVALSFSGCNLDPDSSWFKKDGDTVAGVDDSTVGDTDTHTDVPATDGDTAVDTGADTDTLTDTMPDEDTPVATGVIPDIQHGEVSLDSTVEFEAVVTAVEYALDANYEPTGIKGLFVSETGFSTALPWSGIYIFIQTPAAADAYARGDLLSVSGTYKEYYEMSQVENATLGKLGTADVPVPAYIADPSVVATPFTNNGTEWVPTTDHGAQGEQWESVLIEVHDVAVTNEDLGHGQWEVTGGLVIDKKLFYYPGERSTGTKFKRITGILVYTFDAFKLAPRDADDLELDDGTGTDDDTVVTDDGTVVTDDGTTTTDDNSVIPDTDTAADGVISDIQQGSVSLNSTVEFEAVVTAVEYVLDTSYNPTGIKGLFVSEIGFSTALPWSGIYIFIQTPAALDAYARGDLLSVSGTYKEYKGASQVENATLNKISTAPIPAPAYIADPSVVATPFMNNGTEWVPTTNHGAQGEQWESVLIEVHDVTVTNEDLGHGQWEVTGGLAIDKKLFYFPGTRTNGTQFSRITGILVYTFDAFKLAPRDAADVVAK